MANQQDIQETYDYIDELFRLSLGEHGDYTCAMFNGDFSKTLDEAQADKHRYIRNGINFKPGDRVLDIGSGWGPMLTAIQQAGGTAVGLTLSPAQAAACRRQGLDARLQDWKEVSVSKLGRFDGVISVGAFEHFCSIKEYQAGQQEQIYRDFFSLCASLLPPGGRLYLQTMMWGKQVPNPATASFSAPKHSDEWVLAYVREFFPGSWLPTGLEQITRTASAHFRLISENNGRLDYLETLKRWGKAFRKPQVNKIIPVLKWLPKIITDQSFRRKLMVGYYGSVTQVFKREIFTHQRLVFEKT